MDVQQHYPPLLVYQNLQTVLANRRLELESGSVATGRRAQQKASGWLEDEQFINTIRSIDFVVVEARDGETKTRRHGRDRPTRTFIVIMDQMETVNSQKLDLSIGKLPRMRALDRDFHTDILLITQDPLNSYANRKLDSFLFAGDARRGRIDIIAKTYELFIYDIFTNYQVPPHRVLDIPEETEQLQMMQITKDQLPAISRLDPVVVVIGAGVDDVVEIQLWHPNCGIEMQYRRVIA